MCQKEKSMILIQVQNGFFAVLNKHFIVLMSLKIVDVQPGLDIMKEVRRSLTKIYYESVK